jgi:hypothetical protein
LFSFQNFDIEDESPLILGVAVVGGGGGGRSSYCGFGSGAQFNRKAFKAFKALNRR